MTQHTPHPSRIAGRAATPQEWQDYAATLTPGARVREISADVRGVVTTAPTGSHLDAGMAYVRWDDNTAGWTSLDRVEHDQGTVRCGAIHDGGALCSLPASHTGTHRGRGGRTLGEINWSPSDQVPTVDRTDDEIARDMMTRAAAVLSDVLAAGMPLGTLVINQHACPRRYAEHPERARDLWVLSIQVADLDAVSAYAAHWGVELLPYPRVTGDDGWVHAHTVARGVAVGAWCQVDAVELIAVAQEVSA